MSSPNTIVVSTSAQLAKAIAELRGGETILLNPGDYGHVQIKGRTLGVTATIKSADPNHDAVFTDLRIDRSSGFRIEDIDVHRPLLRGESDSTPAVFLSKTSNIDLIALDVSGSLDGNSWNDGIGVRVDDSSSIRLLDSTFVQLNVASYFANVSNAVLAGNSVSDVREGFDFGGVSHTIIAQNRFTGFSPNYAVGDHSDAIQFWNSGVNKGSDTITITDNVILQGANGGTQGIFVRAELAAYRFTNFTIENNLYYGDSRHGISLNGVDGATIIGNTLVSAPGGYLETGIVLVNDTAISVTRNIVPLILPATSVSGLLVKDNVDLWDTAQKSGLAIKDVFASSTGAVGADSFVAKSGGLAAQLGAGFHIVDGIGASNFDLGHVSSYAHLAGLLPIA